MRCSYKIWPISADSLPALSSKAYYKIFSSLLAALFQLPLTQTISSTNHCIAWSILLNIIFFIMPYLYCRINEAEIVFGDLCCCFGRNRGYHDTKIVTELSKVKKG